MKHIIDKMLEDLEAGINKRDVRYSRFGKLDPIPEQMSKAGLIMVYPVKTITDTVATGFTQRSEFSLKISLTRNTKDLFYKNASKESGSEYLLRVAENRDENGAPQSGAIEYIIRSNMRRYGIVQLATEIVYDLDGLDSSQKDVVQAVMTVKQLGHNVQII